MESGIMEKWKVLVNTLGQMVKNIKDIIKKIKKVDMEY